MPYRPLDTDAGWLAFRFMRLCHEYQALNPTPTLNLKLRVLEAELEHYIQQTKENHHDTSH